jgi:hypothetical protein
MSSNLRNKSYVFKNKQLTKDEYKERINQYNLSSFSIRAELEKEFLSMLKESAIHKDVDGERNVGSVGNMIFGTKNVKQCFDVDVAEDSKYLFSVLGMKDSMDAYHMGINTELTYECHACLRVYNTQFSHLCYDNSNIMYCDSCQNSQNLFGCISVKKGEYMILNKKYEKAEYEVLKAKIIEHMKNTSEYGEFFPPQIAPVAYNETQGNYYMPMSREDVLSKGWQWEDKVPGTFGKETLSEAQIPDTIDEVGDDITSAVLKCHDCTKNYNIVTDELTFYRREGVPLPHSCPDCRYKFRFALRPERKLYSRTCNCDRVGHSHADKVCDTAIETSYAPNRPEKVYCKACYQAEVL